MLESDTNVICSLLHTSNCYESADPRQMFTCGRRWWRSISAGSTAASACRCARAFVAASCGCRVGVWIEVRIEL